MTCLKALFYFCILLVATSCPEMSIPMAMATSLFKTKQCITLDLAKQIAGAAAREVILYSCVTLAGHICNPAPFGNYSS